MPALLHRTTTVLFLSLVAVVVLSSAPADARAASDASSFEARIAAARKTSGLPGPP